MNERKWKLNEDMHPQDCILDPVTFQQVIDAAHCNEKVLNAKAIKRIAKEILESRLEDFEYLIQNNINEIIAEAKKGRN
jgi:hypothetical protein